jgi:hypothetical protein
MVRSPPKRVFRLKRRYGSNPIPHKYNRERLWEHFYGKSQMEPCVWCDRQMPKKSMEWHASHIYPKRKYPQFDKEKYMIPMCASCNMGQGEEIMWEWVKKRFPEKYELMR